MQCQQFSNIANTLRGTAGVIHCFLNPLRFFKTFGFTYFKTMSFHPSCYELEDLVQPREVLSTMTSSYSPLGSYNSCLREAIETILGAASFSMVTLHSNVGNSLGVQCS